jgi:hypothetical protein
MRQRIDSVSILKTQGAVLGWSESRNEDERADVKHKGGISSNIVTT